jgi:predicted secreted protein
MAETQARIGYGAQLQYGDGGSPEMFATVAEIVDTISGPSLTADQVEATHMESPDGYREYISGLKDGEEVTFTCNYLPTNQSQLGLLAIFESGSRRTWRRVLPMFSPPVTQEFRANVTGFNYDTPVDDKMTFEVTLKVTGKPAFLE